MRRSKVWQSCSTWTVDSLPCQPGVGTAGVWRAGERGQGPKWAKTPPKNPIRRKGLGANELCAHQAVQTLWQPPPGCDPARGPCGLSHKHPTNCHGCRCPPAPPEAEPWIFQPEVVGNKAQPEQGLGAVWHRNV